MRSFTFNRLNVPHENSKCGPLHCGHFQSLPVFVVHPSNLHLLWQLKSQLVDALGDQNLLLLFSVFSHFFFVVTFTA